MIKDSGDRTEFPSGAVRDTQEGKGRCDLLPLGVVGAFLVDPVILLINDFQRTGEVDYLYDAISSSGAFPDAYTTILEVAIHFEDGCKKYGERNWEKGIPVNRYIDSGVRHYLKYLRGDKDERHDRAFVWNLLCAIWTVNNRPGDNEDGDEV